MSTQTTQVTLVVTPIADFGISVSPPSQTVNQGQNIGYGVTVSSVNGFTGLVNLSITGLPPGASFTFNPSSLQGSGLSSLAIVPGANTPGGTYTLTITGTSGPVVHSATATLTILVPDFSLSVFAGVSNHPGRPVHQLYGHFLADQQLRGNGELHRYRAANRRHANVQSFVIEQCWHHKPVNHYQQFDPAGHVSAYDHRHGWGTYSYDLSQPGSGRRAGSRFHHLHRGPANHHGKTQLQRHDTVTIGAVNGFTGVVTLSTSGLPSTVTTSFAPVSVTTSGTSSLTFTVDHRAAQGVYNVTVTGTSGHLVHSTTITLTVN